MFEVVGKPSQRNAPGAESKIHRVRLERWSAEEPLLLVLVLGRPYQEPASYGHPSLGSRLCPGALRSPTAAGFLRAKCSVGRHNGLPYCFADFINPDGAAYARIYRERFCASETLAEPRVIVACFAVCAETGDEAQRVGLQRAHDAGVIE